MSAIEMLTNKISHIHMTIEEWEKVKDCPTQRDTARHARTAAAAGKHLSKPHPAHAMVSMARTPKGQCWKLDGHSRSLLWSNGELAPAPERLDVTVFEVKNRAECIEFYDTFDNSGATENRRDKLTGALKFHNATPHHGYMFNNTGVISAIEYTVFPQKYSDLRDISFLEMVAPWVEAIKIMDAGDYPNHNLFRSPVMLAALMTFRRDGNTAQSFWQGYHDDIGKYDGKKSDRSCDGIFFARDCFSIMKHEQESKYGRRMFSIYTMYYLWAYDKWYADERVKRIASIEGRRVPKDMLTVREWFEEYLGELDHPQLRPVAEVDEDQMALI